MAAAQASFVSSDEQFSISRAHDDGANAYRCSRPGHPQTNPYHSPLYAWAWDLGWRFAAHMERHG
jgi:hypothetical protein